MEKFGVVEHFLYSYGKAVVDEALIFEFSGKYMVRLGYSGAVNSFEGLFSVAGLYPEDCFHSSMNLRDFQSNFSSLVVQ